MNKLRRILLTVAILLVPFLLAGCQSKKQETQGPVTLTVWDPVDSDTVFSSLVSSYQSSHPNVTIKFQKKKLSGYKDSLVSRIPDQKAGVEVPDVFLVHNSWTGELSGILATMPPSVFGADEYKKTFYPAASASLTQGKSIVAVPAYFDGLALYMNTDLTGETAPTTWTDLQTAAVKIATKDPKTGSVAIGGAALGMADNVDHFSDILSLMMLQNGVSDLRKIDTSLAKDGRNLGEDALTFYSQFAQGTNKVWDGAMPASTTAFVTGRLGFYFAPAWRAIEIKTANPALKFKVVPVPQLSGGSANWASFWAWSVSSKSLNAQAAWDFVKFISTAESQKQIFAQTVKSRGVGEPYGRVDLAKLLSGDPILGAYLLEAPTAYSMPSSAGTSDGNGFVDSNVNYLKNAVNSAAKGETAKTALSTAAAGINQNFANLSPKK